MGATEPFPSGVEARRFQFFRADPPASLGSREPLAVFPQHSSSVALQEAIDVQLETLEAIRRTERLMGMAEDLGTSSRQQLAQDKVLIEIIDTSLEKNESTLHRVRRDVCWFRVQLQRDKVFLCLFAIAIALSVGAIVVSIVYKNKQ